MEARLAGKARRRCIGPYVLLERLGHGGMGHVFKAKHRLMKRVVALKIAARKQPESENATVSLHFRREVEAVAQLRHPNIVTAYDAGIARGRLYLAMEYIEGVDLEQRVRDSGPLPVDLVCEIMRQTAEALHHAHQHGLVHGDLKPANLMLAAADEAVKLLDLGLAQWTSDRLSTRRELCGTPDFMAPERGSDPHCVDGRADLYSLGCTFYFLLTGQVPYPGGTWTEKLLRHSFEEPAALTTLRPEVPLGVERVVQRLMARSVEERYASASDVAVDLASLSANSPVRPTVREVSRCNSNSGSPRRSRKAARFLFASAAFVLLGGAAGSGVHRIISAPSTPTPIGPSARARQFVIEGRETAFASLEKAIVEAGDGDVITIHASGPFAMPPFAWHGKRLTIQAVRGVRPRLVMKKPDDPWQALLQTDRPLTLVGLEITSSSEQMKGSLAPKPPLISCLHGSLSMTNCRLIADADGTAISLRNANDASLQGCHIEAGTVALSMEAAKQGTCRLLLSDCNISVRSDCGAALSLWGEEARRTNPIELSLRNNKITGGRLMAWRDLHAPLTMTAHDNRFYYRNAILSCSGTAAWHDAVLQGSGNRYEGPNSWLWVNGRALESPHLKLP